MMQWTARTKRCAIVRFSAVGMLSVIMLILTGCGGDNGTFRGPEREAVQRSAVLEQALEQIVAEWLAEQADDSQAVDPEEVDAYVELIQREMGVLLVTERMEQAFEQGEFPEAERQAAMDRALSRLEIFGAELPGIMNMLLDEYYAGTLDGARLELAWRMLDYYDRDIGQRIWPD